jgi:hypothetical protein
MIKNEIYTLKRTIQSLFIKNKEQNNKFNEHKNLYFNDEFLFLNTFFDEK